MGEKKRSGLIQGLWGHFSGMQDCLYTGPVVLQGPKCAFELAYTDYIFTSQLFVITYCHTFFRQTAGAATRELSQVKNYSQRNMEQALSRCHEAGPLSWLGVARGWLHWCPISKKLHGLSARAHARGTHEFPCFCFSRVTRRGAARGSAIQGLGKGALCLSRPCC